MWGISPVAQNLLASKEGLCSIELVCIDQIEFLQFYTLLAPEGEGGGILSRK